LRFAGLSYQPIHRSHGPVRRGDQPTEQPDRDEVASMLLQYGDQVGYDWADIIDFLTMWPDGRRQVVRLLGEIEAK
jgi:hypothetical protein